MKKIIYLFSALILVVSSCKKDDDATPAATSSTTTVVNTTPDWPDADGLFAAIISNNWIDIPFVGPFNMPYGTAGGYVFSSTGATTFIDAGTIKCDDTLLVRDNTNFYSYKGTGSSATGLQYSSGNAKWEIGGNSSVVGFNYTTTNGFPEIDSISSANTLFSGFSYTLSTSSMITNSDSVIFLIARGGKAYVVTRGPGTTSHTFSAAEVSALGVGTGVAEIIPYSLESKVANGKKYYFLNENTVTKAITIQ
jgi:hypothetical protein